MSESSKPVQVDANDEEVLNELLNTPIRWEIAIDLILQGLTDLKVGEKMGIDQSTVWRWRQKDDFQAALQAERKRRRDARNYKLEHASEVAIDSLVDVSQNSKDDKARVQASKELLDRVEGTEPRLVNKQISDLTDEQIEARREAIRARKAELEKQEA